jgi:polyisoprenoid-binding protein YceI
MENNGAVLTRQNSQKPEWLSEWSLNSDTSSLKFFITQRNFLGRPFRKITGAFKVFEGCIRSNTEDFSDANIHLILEADSIETGNKKRDNHLSSVDFFDTQKFPFIRFHSVSFEKGKSNNYLLEGDCVIHGVSKRLVVDVIFEGNKENGYGNKKASFHSCFQINRHDFGIKSNVFFEALITKEITVVLDLEFLEVSATIY